jgi:hypothetical protein
MNRPVVTYSINFSKDGIRHIVIIFIPLFVALLFSLFTFMVGLSDAFNRFRLSVGALTAMLSYRFIIERMMPRVGYFTTTDSVYTLLLMISLCVFIMQIGISLYNYMGRGIKKKDEPRLQHINDSLFLVVIAVLVGFMAYLIVW